jgi:drug/metabolite transporter (DMT)-like permease
LSITIATIASLVASLLFGISAVAQRRGTKRVEGERALSPRILLDLVRQPVWVLGVGATVLGNIAHIFALSQGPLSLVEPLMVSALVFATLISAYLTRHWDPAVLAGAAVCFLGIAGFLAIGRPKGGHSSVGFLVVLPLAAGLAIGVTACLAVAKRRSALRPLALALASGICTGVGAFLIKLVTGEFGHGLAHLFTNWPIYTLAVVGPLGLILNQNAFQQSTAVAQVLSIVTTVNPIVAIALGLVWLGETIKSSPLAITGEVGSLILATIGVVVIAYRSPHVAQQAEDAKASPPGK